MSEPILHHYHMSPFSEKVRLMFGAKRIAWKSVVIPSIMPKPDVVALTGGYRKTPILQLGADIYCDTALIAEKLEELAPRPTLYPTAHAATARMAARWIDSMLFQVAVTYVFQPATLARVFGPGGRSDVDMGKFVADRMAMPRHPSSRRVPVPEASAIFEKMLRELDVQLSGQSFLFGSEPCIADYSAYHCIWFAQRSEVATAVVAPHKNVGTWLARMAALGHGSVTEIPSGEAVEIANRAKPAPLAGRCDVEGFTLGELVEVAPCDYGTESSAGELVTCTPDEIAIRRTDPRAGEVVVHFPREQYELRKPTA